MGTKIIELASAREIGLEELSNKTLAIDSHIFLYQFLTTIRQRDGSYLTDSKGNITSHLIGLFYRIVSLLNNKCKLIFVFDGTPPKLKMQEVKTRTERKILALEKYKIAKTEEDIESMKKYASQTVHLTKEMIAEAKELITAFGCPIIEAPSEGEAQAAKIVLNNDAFAVCSNDADALLFCAPRLIRNLSISGKRKRINQTTYKTINPDLISLSDTLNNLGIDHDQLIVLAMLVGTDYSPSGVKGVGPKTALKKVKEFGKDFDSLFKTLEWDKYSLVPWKDVFDTIKNMPTLNTYKLDFTRVDKDKVIDILCNRHDFSLERVNQHLLKLVSNTQKNQKGLGDFF